MRRLDEHSNPCTIQCYCTLVDVGKALRTCRKLRRHFLWGCPSRDLCLEPFLNSQARVPRNPAITTNPVFVGDLPKSHEHPAATSSTELSHHGHNIQESFFEVI